MNGTIADFFNAPTEFALDGETFRLRKPEQLEQGEFQRWLEQLAYDAINRRTYQDTGEKERALRAHDLECAAGTFEWGSEWAVRRLMTARGLAKLLSIICRDQGLTEEKAAKLVELEQRKIAATLASRLTADPKAREAVLATLGLPNDFFSSSSATPPSTAPSPNSADSTTIS